MTRRSSLPCCWASAANRCRNGRPSARARRWDGLLRMCALFECTPDELVCGDLTGRAAAEASSVPAGKPQDVTGYDQAAHVRVKLPLGIAVVILGAALALLLSDPALMPSLEVRNFATVLVFVGAAAGLALILPASFECSAFRKAHLRRRLHTADQKTHKPESDFRRGRGGHRPHLGGDGCDHRAAGGRVACKARCSSVRCGRFRHRARSCLLGSRCNLTRYNRRSLEV